MSWHDTKRHLEVRLQFWRFRGCGAPVYCHGPQVHSDLRSGLVWVGFIYGISTIVVCFGLVWFDLIWFMACGLVWFFYLVVFGLIWFMAYQPLWFVLIWFGLILFGSVWFMAYRPLCLVWFDLVWFIPYQLLWFDLIWLVWFGCVLRHINHCGFV